MSDPTSNRDAIISSFSTKIFSAMLQEVLMDAVLQSHKDLMRSKCICIKCGTNCGSSCSSKEQHDKHPETLPDGTTSMQEVASAHVSGTTTPIPKDKHDGNIYFECSVCQKKVSSNRYAPHLSGCLGLDTRARRGAARNATTKNKLNADHDNDRFGALGTLSDRPSPSVEPPSHGKAKPKPKPLKKQNGVSKDSTEISGLKRPPGSLDNSPAKRLKNQKSGILAKTTHLQDNDIGGGDEKKLSMSVLAKLPHKSATPASPSARSGSQYSGRESPAASATHSASVSSLTGHSPNGFTKSVARRPSKPGSAEQIAKKLSLQSQQHTSLSSDSSTRSKLLEKEEGIVDVDGEEPDSSSSDSSDD